MQIIVVVTTEREVSARAGLGGLGLGAEQACELGPAASVSFMAAPVGRSLTSKSDRLLVPGNGSVPLLTRFVPDDSVRRELEDATGTHGNLRETRMAKETTNHRGTAERRAGDDHNAVIPMAAALVKETQVAGEEGGTFVAMQVADDLILVEPLRALDLKADVDTADVPAMQLLNLISREVVIKDNHAAERTETSRTTPRRTRDAASRTAAALRMPRYCRATASGV